MTNVLLRLMRRSGGEAAVTAVLEQAGTEHRASYLENVENWISLDEACTLFEAGVHVTGDPLFARRVGEATLRQHAGTQVATLLRSLGSPEAVLHAIAQAASKVSTVTEMVAIEAGPGGALVRAAAREGFTRRALHCDWTTGLLAGLPVLFGLPLAAVEESQCQARGDTQCLYTVTWDAEQAARAADPQQRITALEAELSAMSERMQSAYATASDLVSVEDLDTVLRRIVERAANAVRAPGYVLAVHATPGAGLQVYSHGIDDAQARKLADESLEPGAAPRESVLSVPVTSGRREYGRLIAHYPGEIQFFPQEREILGLYAKHAAAVLDMATALQLAAQRHDQVSSLLALSHALAQAGTSEEMAERLAVAVPQVVDCDRMNVWLWDDGDECLRSLCAEGSTAEQAPNGAGATIITADARRLRPMITGVSGREPLFLDGETETALQRRLMSGRDVAAMAVVPIVARDVFLGILNVAVSDQPQRLAFERELVERLTGVAALAAPAIQNGRLVDELRHKASHDGLTGLLNRVGFGQQIDSFLETAGRENEHVGLLFIDLNGFKEVNDIHGHQAGDELLRQAASRLVTIARTEDHVARLGGDEFAVILANVGRDDELAAAELRVRIAFAEPFRLGCAPVSVSASLGAGIWPDHGQTVKELVRHADAAMYLDKAHSALQATLPPRRVSPALHVVA